MIDKDHESLRHTITKLLKHSFNDNIYMQKHISYKLLIISENVGTIIMLEKDTFTIEF